MNTDTQITLEHQQEVSVINITGNLDFSCYSSLYGQIQAIPATGNLTVNLKQCENIDSSGLGMLLLIREKLKGKALISIEDANETIAKKLEISKFNQLFRVA